MLWFVLFRNGIFFAAVVVSSFFFASLSTLNATHNWNCVCTWMHCWEINYYKEMQKNIYTKWSNNNNLLENAIEMKKKKNQNESTWTHTKHNYRIAATMNFYNGKYRLGQWKCSLQKHIHWPCFASVWMCVCVCESQRDTDTAKKKETKHESFDHIIYDFWTI